jgi:hypothetical protein
MNNEIKNYLVERLQWISSDCDYTSPKRPNCMYDIPKDEVSKILDDFDLNVQEHIDHKKNVANPFKVALTTLLTLGSAAAYVVFASSGSHLVIPYIAGTTFASLKTSKKISDDFVKNFDPRLATIVCDTVSDLQARLAHCPVCRESLCDTLYICKDCGAAYHPDCYEYIGKCSRYGCESQKPRTKTPVSDKSEKEKTSLEDYLDSLKVSLSRINL